MILSETLDYVVIIKLKINLLLNVISVDHKTFFINFIGLCVF